MIVHQTCIERLLIVYFGLCEAVTGKSLDEDASEAELLEEVLLDSSSWSSSSKESLSGISSSSSPAERLVYLGLCKALYQLPSVFSPQGEGEEEQVDDFQRTNSVELEHCTLLFLPLEGDPNLVAIVQVKHNNISQRNVSLMAIQNAVECSHALFCLLEQWGVTRRRQEAGGEPGAGTTSDDGEKELALFQGLEEAYRLRKVARQLNSLRQYHPGQQRVEVLHKLEALQSTLYISAVCVKLKNHYSSFLHEEGIPSSIIVVASNNTKRSSMISGPSAVVVDMNELCEAIHAATKRLLGVSVLDRDGILLASTAPLAATPLVALWRWLSKYHTMHRQSSLVQSFLFLPPTTANTSSTYFASDSFLEPPPLSQLSASYVTDDVADHQILPDGRTVWTPKIYFHVASTARVAFYRSNSDDTSFLIFFGPDQAIDWNVVEMTIAERLPTVLHRSMIAVDAVPGAVTTKTVDVLDEAVVRDRAKAAGAYYYHGTKTKTFVVKSSIDGATRTGTTTGIDEALNHFELRGGAR
jgi:hypothetical protein